MFYITGDRTKRERERESAHQRKKKIEPRVDRARKVESIEVDCGVERGRSKFFHGKLFSQGSEEFFSSKMRENMSRDPFCGEILYGKFLQSNSPFCGKLLEKKCPSNAP